MTLQDPRPARLAQSVEQQACELRVASLSPGMSDSLQRFRRPSLFHGGNCWLLASWRVQYWLETQGMP